MKTLAMIAAILLITTAAQGQEMRAGDRANFGKRTFPLATMEADNKCAAIVAPYELETNFVDLVKLTGSTVASQVTDWVGNLTQGRIGNQPVSKSGVSSAVREQAIRMNWLPMSFEVAYGEHQLNDFRDRKMILEKTGDRKNLYPIAERMLADVVGKIVETHPYQFQIFIRRENGGNAAALPGGFILIDTDLLDNPQKHEQAVLAISHEVSHVLRRHETRALQARVVDSVALAGSAADLVRYISNIATTHERLLALVVAGKLQFENHSSDQELQADACSVRVAQRTFEDDRRLVSSIKGFLASLPPQEDPGKPPEANRLNGDQIKDILEREVQRHPTTQERVAFFNAILKDVLANGIAEAPPAQRAIIGGGDKRPLPAKPRKK